MLTQLLRERDDVALLLGSLVDYRENGNGAPPMLAPPRTDHYALVGTAFDYLLRWELERLNPAARDREWVATTAIRMIREMSRSQARAIGFGGGLADTYQAIVREALRFHSHYVKIRGRLPDAVLEAAARLVLVLARIDPFVRAGRVDPLVNEVDPLDMADIIGLYRVTPWTRLGAAAGDVPLLNPAFGKVSERFEGADADLVIAGGGRGDLVDFKTTKHIVGTYGMVKHLPQLVGYGMITDLYREEQPGFPRIVRAGIYFARHGVLSLFDFEAVRSHPGYAPARDLLVAAADDMFGPAAKERRRGVARDDGPG